MTKTMIKKRVEIKFKNPKKTGTVTVRDYRGPDGQTIEFKDKHGNPRVKRYTKPLNVLDLNKPDDLLEYNHVKGHPIYVTGPEASLIVVDVTEEATTKNTKRENSLDAQLEARALKGEKLADFARVLGISTKNVDEEVVKDAVYGIAEQEPERFMSEWSDPNKLFKQVIFKGRQREIFTLSNNVWYYRKTIMGSTIEEVIQWCKENEDLMPSIRKEINALK